MSMTRKQFLRSLAGVGVTAVGVSALAACGGDDGGKPDAPGASCTANGTTASIAGNHGHVLVVSAADVTAGADKTYDITGTAVHTHMVTVTAAMFTMLAANMTIMVISTTGSAHTHNVTVMCA